MFVSFFYSFFTRLSFGFVECTTVNSLEALSTLMMNSDTAEVDIIAVLCEATTEGWAALARALSKTSVRVAFMLAAEALLREARKEDREIIVDKCDVLTKIEFSILSS